MLIHDGNCDRAPAWRVRKKLAGCNVQATAIRQLEREGTEGLCLVNVSWKVFQARPRKQRKRS